MPMINRLFSARKIAIYKCQMIYYHRFFIANLHVLVSSVVNTSVCGINFVYISIKY